jgi:hypothetical protein
LVDFVDFEPFFDLFCGVWDHFVFSVLVGDEVVGIESVCYFFDFDYDFPGVVFDGCIFHIDSPGGLFVWCGLIKTGYL